MTPDGGRRAATAIPELESRMLEAVEQAVVATDPQGRITFWNRFAEQLFGWGAEEVLGQAVVEVIVAAARFDEAYQILAALQQGQSWRGALEMQRRDGATFTAMVATAALREGDAVAGLVGIMTDVTDESRTQELLRSSEHRLRSLFDSIDEGYALCEMVVDDAGRPIDYRFLEINPLFEEMTGLTDPVGRTALELVPDLEPQWVQTYAQVGLDRQTLRFSQGSDAMGRWFDVFAVPMEPAPQFAVVFKDETARRRAEDGLRESEQRFRKMADQLPLVVWLHGANGQQEWVNQTYCSFFGVTREEMRDDRWQMLTHPDDGTSYVEAFARAVEQRTAFHGEVRVRAAGGTWRWLESWAQPRYGEDGEYLGHLGTSADITDRKAAAAEQARAEAALRQHFVRAELVAELLSAMEAEATVAGQVERLAQLLVPRVADFVTVEVPGSTEPLVAYAHRDPAQLETLRTLRNEHRLDPDQAHSIFQAAVGRPQLIVEISPELVHRYADGSRASELLVQLGPRSVIAVPLELGGGTRGALMVGLSDPVRPPYGPEDLAYMEATARRVEVILAAAHLRQREHDIAVRLQQALLPDELLAHPRLELAARYQAASDLLEVGGDWYDTFAWPSGHIGVIVGDVMGHNLDSAAAMGRLRAATAALSAHVPASPAAVLDALASFASGPNGTPFVTAVCAVIDPQTGVLVYSGAGHPPIVVLPPGGSPVELNDALDPPMGVRDPRTGHTRPEASVTLEPGSLVVLYSDGLIERRYEGLDVGLARLARVVTAVAHEPIDTVADRIVADMAQGIAAEDDVVVACLRFLPHRSGVSGGRRCG